MRMLISPKQMSDTEKKYFETSGVKSIRVMETAAKAMADEALARWGNVGRVYIACGPGGNGGDGYACARLLHEAGMRCEIYASAPAKSPDAIENLCRAQELGIPVYEEGLPKKRPGLWIDCLYGTGLSRAPEGRSAQLIYWMNNDHSTGAGVLACDIPSGLNGHTGAASEPCVQADVTVSFQLAKYGHYLQDGLEACGEVIVADVGFPRKIFREFQPPHASVFLFDRELHLLRRRRNSHKGTYGHLLIIAGSIGMAGAAALCARAALRSGVGLVSIACPESIVPILQVYAPCAMCIPLPEEGGAISIRALPVLEEALKGKTAIAIGPGLTRSVPKEIIGAVLGSNLPSVVDADALNILSENPDLKALLKDHHVITPHPGEAARLLGRRCADPVADARELAGLGATTVLKGASRVIAGELGCCISASGSCGMARGGSGDVFTSILGALMAQRGMPVEYCAGVACEIHGQAGELAQAKYGSYAMNSADIIEFLPEVFRRYAQ